MIQATVRTVITAPQPYNNNPCGAQLLYDIPAARTMANAARRGAAQPQLRFRAAGGLASTTGCLISRPQDDAARTLLDRFCSQRTTVLAAPPAAIWASREPTTTSGPNCGGSRVQEPHCGGYSRRTSRTGVRNSVYTRYCTCMHSPYHGNVF